MRPSGFSDEDILDAQLAAEEAVTNTIRHGYRGYGGTISVSCSVTPDRADVTITDRAPRFDPLSVPEPDTGAGLEERRIGGLGIFLIRQVMDSVTYRYENGRNILTLVKEKK